MPFPALRYQGSQYLVVSSLGVQNEICVFMLVHEIQQIAPGKWRVFVQTQSACQFISGSLLERFVQTVLPLVPIMSTENRAILEKHQINLKKPDALVVVQQESFPTVCVGLAVYAAKSVGGVPVWFVVVLQV